MGKVRVRVVMEAEIDDLKSIYPDDPKGVTVFNVAHALSVIRTAPIEQIMRIRNEIGKLDIATFKHLCLSHTDDSKLGDRLMESLSIELLETTREIKVGTVARLIECNCDVVVEEINSQDDIVLDTGDVIKASDFQENGGCLYQIVREK